MADSDASSSVIPNSVETPEESESSSPIASIEAQVAQSLALSSPDRDRDNHDSVSIPPPDSDGYTSSSSDETQFVSSRVNLEQGECSNDDDDDTQPMLESQITPSDHHPVSYNNAYQIGSTSDAPDDLDDSLWDACASDNPMTPNVSPGYGSDDGDNDTKMESNQPPLLLGFHQEHMKIEEPSNVGAGIWNLGNTCFLNSVLQCFTHTVALIESLRCFKFQYPCNCGNDNFCVIKSLRGHIGEALRPTRYPMSPHHFLNNLNYFSPDFQRFQQEDAHEFLQAFLDKLERCCLDRRSYRGYAPSQDVNIVENIFGGRLVSELRCCNCNSVSETFEHSVGLSLEIEDVGSLADALESFTRVEKLDEQLTCDQCNEKVSKEKQLLLDKLPLVATFHLKRFKNDGVCMEKIFKNVGIPLELDLEPYMRCGQENGVSTRYHLYAFVQHLGYSLAYGHYSSYVRSSPRVWHLFDDMQVTRVEEEHVPTQHAYILFYAREGTPWFSRAFEEMMEACLRDSSPKSVLDSTNAECLSGISYENVDKANKACESAGVSNQHVKTDENSVSLSDEPTEEVFLSAESSGEDSPMPKLADPLETEDSYKPCTEKESDSFLATERATSGDDFFPLLMDDNQDLSPKSQEVTFESQLKQLEEITKKQEELCKRPLLLSDIGELMVTEYAHRDLMKKPSPRARELLDQAVSATGSPPKKVKTA